MVTTVAVFYQLRLAAVAVARRQIEQHQSPLGKMPLRQPPWAVSITRSDLLRARSELTNQMYVGGV